MPLAEIVEKLAYESKASFNCAFKKFKEKTPGRCGERLRER